MSDSEDFSIGTVSRLTGISQHTLRVWERRHGAVQSQRSDGGQRLYSSEDVERLTVLKTLVDLGDRIGKIAGEETDVLRARVATHVDHSQTRTQLASGTLTLGVFGESLAAQLRETPPAGARVIVAETDLKRFETDLSLQSLDALLLEIPTIQAGTPDLVASLRRAARTENVLVVYGFGKSSDVSRLAVGGTQLLRSPADLHAIAYMLGLKTADCGARSDSATNDTQPPASDVMEAPPRLLSGEALQRLSNATATVECECPHHLVDLVRSLTAFELYSAQCRNNNEADAALHAYLHATTARARALIEEALIKTAKAEGIAY